VWKQRIAPFKIGGDLCEWGAQAEWAKPLLGSRIEPDHTAELGAPPVCPDRGPLAPRECGAVVERRFGIPGLRVGRISLGLELRGLPNRGSSQQSAVSSQQ
jgi:hypothetical protein